MTTSLKTDDVIPEYGQSPAKPGLYLGLFHGRNDPDERMNDWGFNGPSIGPLVWCHTTYANDVKIEFECACDAKRYFGDDSTHQDFGIHGDMLIYAGKYYGDWTVYYVAPSECLPPEDTFRTSKRAAYRIAHNPMPKQQEVCLAYCFSRRKAVCPQRQSHAMIGPESRYSLGCISTCN